MRFPGVLADILNELGKCCLRVIFVMFEVAHLHVRLCFIMPMTKGVCCTGGVIHFVNYFCLVKPCTS